MENKTVDELLLQVREDIDRIDRQLLPLFITCVRKLKKQRIVKKIWKMSQISPKIPLPVPTYRWAKKPLKKAVAQVAARTLRLLRNVPMLLWKRLSKRPKNFSGATRNNPQHTIHQSMVILQPCSF